MKIFLSLVLVLLTTNAMAREPDYRHITEAGERLDSLLEKVLKSSKTTEDATMSQQLRLLHHAALELVFCCIDRPSKRFHFV